MVRYRRNYIPGGTYFFTVTLEDRRSAALVENIGALRIAFRHVRERRPFTVDAIVILPEHLHAVLTLPDGDKDFSGRWRQIKEGFTRQLTKTGIPVERRTNGEWALWQRRFWEHTIRDEGDLVRHIDYIHFNPVKHGHVTCVSAWPYSSFHAYVRRGVLPEDWGGDAGENTSSFGERGE
jgi:putative transposase